MKWTIKVPGPSEETKILTDIWQKVRVPFVLTNLTSITGYVTDLSDIYRSSNDCTKTPVKCFDFIVHSKEKVARAICFSPQKEPFITSLNRPKNKGIEWKKVRVSDSIDKLLCSVLKESKVSSV